MRIPKSLTRAAMDGHGLIGVLFGAVIFILCLTGSIVVLTDQLTVWERPDAPTVTTASPSFIADVSARALVQARAAGMAHDIFLHVPTAELPRMSVMGLDGKGGHREWNVDAAGRLLPHAETPWTEFVELLHFNLTVPGAIGRYVVGLFGTILLASLVTGLFAHRRILKDAFRLRWGGSRRLSNADLHNRIGVWALPFHLIVALTGSLLGLAGLITLLLALAAYRGDQEKAIASLLGSQASADARPAPLPDLPTMLDAIKADTPGAAITMIMYEQAGTAGQQVRIMTDAPRHLSRNESWTFGNDGRLKWKAGLTDGDAGKRIYGMITPLHYGTYGGVPLKLIYVLLGAGLTVIVATGGNIWLARRRDQGRASPLLERFWAALSWGQPLVLLVMALAMLGTPLPATAAYWALTLLTLIAAARSKTRDIVIRRFRIALAAMLVLLPLAHAGVHGIAVPVAAMLDLAMLLGGIAMLSPALRPARPRPPGRAIPAT